MEPYFVQNPDLSESGPGLRVTWLGHATVLVEMDGLNVLTDPIFSQRASPFQFMGPRRYRGPPCTVEQVECFFYNEVYSVAASLTLRVLNIFFYHHPANSCRGSMLSSSVTPIMTTLMSDPLPASTRASEAHYAGASGRAVINHAHA